MPERAMVFETSQIGVEALAAPGTPVQATKVIAGYSVSVTPNPEVKTFTPKGYKVPSTSVLIREQTDLKIDGLGTYNELVYPLAGAITDPVITTPGGGTLSRLHVFTLHNNAPDSQRTYSMEFGTNAIRAWHNVNCLFTEFGLTFNRKDVVKLSGAMLAQAGLDDKVRWLTITGAPVGGSFTITVGANTTAAIAWNAAASAVQSALVLLASVGTGGAVVTGGPLPATPVRIAFGGPLLANATNPTLPTPLSTTDSLTGGTAPASALTRLSPGTTQLDLIPISPTTIDIKVATTQAGLGAANFLTRDFQFAWKISGRDNPIWPLLSSLGAGFGATVEALPKTEVSLDVAADDIGMGFLANLHKGDTLFVRASALGPLIEGTLFHSYQSDHAVKLTKISEFKDIDGGLLGVTYTGEWVHDPTWGKSLEIAVQNKITAL